jgi:hypothetical protein
MSGPWTNQEIEFLKNNRTLYTVKEIANILGRGVPSVYVRLSKLKVLKNQRWTSDEESFLLENYLVMTDKQISNKLTGRTPTDVNHKIKYLGLVGTRPDGRITYSYDYKFFAIPTALNSQVAGFIASDGCIQKNKVVNIHIHERDRDYLEKIVGLTKFTGPIHKTGSHMLRLDFCGGFWVSDLKQNFLITPVKSLTLKPPTHLNVECQRAFILGLLDGDGCISIQKGGSKKLLRASWAGTEQTMSFIKVFMDTHMPPNNHYIANLVKLGNIFTYTVNGDRAVRILRYLYNSECLRLTRKYEIFRRFVTDV